MSGFAIRVGNVDGLGLFDLVNGMEANHGALQAAHDEDDVVTLQETDKALDV